MLARHVIGRIAFSSPRGTLFARRYSLARPPLIRRPWAYAGAGAIILAVGTASTVTYNDASLEDDGPVKISAQRPRTPLSELVRTYVVYSICSFPTLVDWSPTILSTLMTVPVVGTITEMVVRSTFFAQFVGADTAEDCLPLLHRLRAENKGCLFAYSVEVDELEAAGTKKAHAAVQPVAPHKEAVREMLRCIDIGASFEDQQGSQGSARKTWVAIKLTALVPDASSLIRLSSFLVRTRPTLSQPVNFPGVPRQTELEVLRSDSVPRGPDLTADDMKALVELRDDLIAICSRAQERGVKIIMDAEYSWYQPAVDAYVLALMRRFNKLEGSDETVQPLIYQTFQAYLRRTPAYLAYALAEARASGFSLGVKLVRGAYHPQEIASHLGRGSASSLSISPEAEPPVWSTKDETDASYNACARVLLGAVGDAVAPKPIQQKSWFGAKKGSADAHPSGVGVLFGTHNVDSCNLVLDELVARGLANRLPDGRVQLGDAVLGRVTMGQLYGMHDDLTNKLVDSTVSSSPFVIKYVPYGGLKDVMPYLGRRAIENKSVLFDGAATKERQRAWREIKGRIFS